MHNTVDICLLIVMVCFSSVQVNFLVNYKNILCYCEKFGEKKKKCSWKYSIRSPSVCGRRKLRTWEEIGFSGSVLIWHEMKLLFSRAIRSQHLLRVHEGNGLAKTYSRVFSVRWKWFWRRERSERNSKKRWRNECDCERKWKLGTRTRYVQIFPRGEFILPPRNRRSFYFK